MQVYDNKYDDNFRILTSKGFNLEYTKNLLGRIFQETLNSLTKENKTKESIDFAFSRVLARHGVC